MFTLKKVLFISVAMILGGAFAKAETAAETKEEKKVDKSENKASLAPWVEVENKVTELNSKIKSKQRNILQLIEDKNKMPGSSPELKKLVKELVKEHKELQGLVEEYHQKVGLLKYRFPERNARTERIYKRVEIKSLDEMEQTLGVDGKLNRNLKRMRSQFQEKGGAEMADLLPVSREPASVQKGTEPSIEEADPIIMQK
jgi:hypothetical protein